MGILTDVSYQYDDDEQVLRIYAVTRFAISNRASLNRVANRAVVGHGLGQRTLAVAAFDELGIDMVWREGPFTTVEPEEKFEDAGEITFQYKEIEHASKFGEILTERLQERLKFDEFRRGTYMNIWTVPYEVIDNG